MNVADAAMSGAGRRRPRMDRCRACRLPPALCICDRLPRLVLPFGLLLIQHGRERSSQSNTGGLVHAVFPDAEVILHGHSSRSAGGVPWRSGTDYTVLFPLGPGGVELTPDALAPRSERPRAPVLLDATWRQARRMSRRIDGIRTLPCRRLPGEPARRWTLRRPTRPGQLSTAEALAVALRVTGHEAAAQALEEAIALQASRILHVRGRIRRRDLP